MNERKLLKEFYFIIIPGVLLFFTFFSLLIYGGFWLGRSTGNEDPSSNQDLKRLYATYREMSLEMYFLECMPAGGINFQEKSKSCQIDLLQKKVNQLANEYNAKSLRYSHTFLTRDSLPLHLKVYHFKKI